jgi:acylphosphatase
VRYEGTARLPGGTLKIKGNVRPLANGAIEIPVVGGTGRFASAKGKVLVGPGQLTAANVYELTLSTTIA